MTRSLVLGLVPARGGSKGIPGKNLRPLAGKSLLSYTAAAAQDSGVLDRVVLTTDSQEIAEARRALGLEVPWLRPPELAGDDAPMLPVVRHAVGALEQAGWTPDIVVLLQPTAPLRRPEHLRRAVELLRQSDASSVVSVVEIPAHFRPAYALHVVDGRLEFVLPQGRMLGRRQDAPRAYSRDGTVYAFWRDQAMDGDDIYGERCLPLVLGRHESVNLDDPEDWLEAERRLAG